MMAARTGKPDAIKVLLDNGAQINALETWGGTTAFDVGRFREAILTVRKLLIDRGANVNARSKNCAVGRRPGGFEKRQYRRRTAAILC